MANVRSLVARGPCRLEAEIVLAALLDRRRDQLYTTDREIPLPVERRFFELLDQRKANKPLQYILGNQPFLDFELAVDERVFIPRCETEGLVTRIFSMVSNPDLIVDIGTGSGAIAIAFARHYPRATVIATDCSPSALDVARINAARFGLERRIRFFAADLFTFPGSGALRGCIDLVVSNPPYIPTDDINRLMADVRDYEPLTALDGGPDGLAVIRPLIERAPDFLRPDGLAAFEIDPGLVPAITSLARIAPVIEKDLSGFDRYLFIRRPCARGEAAVGGTP